MRNEIQRISAVVFAGVLLLSDQATKYIFSDSGRAYCNPGGPWGAAVDNETLIVVSGGIIVVIAAVFFRNQSRDSRNPDGLSVKGKIPGQARNDRDGCCLFLKTKEDSLFLTSTLLFTGGASNLLDRILFGCVRDFSLVSWFPAFNLADVSLTVGVALLLFSALVRKNDTPTSWRGV